MYPMCMLCDVLTCVYKFYYILGQGRPRSLSCDTSSCESPGSVLLEKPARTPRNETLS